jgi:hypothetical protein
MTGICYPFIFLGWMYNGVPQLPVPMPALNGIYGEYILTIETSPDWRDMIYECKCEPFPWNS